MRLALGDGRWIGTTEFLALERECAAQAAKIAEKDAYINTLKAIMVEQDKRLGRYENEDGPNLHLQCLRNEKGFQAKIAALEKDVYNERGWRQHYQTMTKVTSKNNTTLRTNIAALEAEVQWQREAPAWMLKHFKQAVEDSKKPHDECSTFVDPWVQRAFDAEAEVERLERQLKVYQESTIEVHSLAPFVALAKAASEYRRLSLCRNNYPNTYNEAWWKAGSNLVDALADPAIQRAVTEAG